MREINILPPPPPTSIESPTLSALAELFYFRFNLITQHITPINHHLSACRSIAPPAARRDGITWFYRYSLVYRPLQVWLGGREISLKDLTKSPPTANSENCFCRYSLVFCSLQVWLGGREHTLKDSTESPPTANSKTWFCRYSLVFCSLQVCRMQTCIKTLEETLASQNQSGILKGDSP